MAALIALEVGSAAISVAGAIFGTRAKNKALQKRLQEETLASNMRSLQRGRSLERILSAQTARQGASGFSLQSPSFGAIQKDTFNQFAQDQDAANLNLLFQKSATEQQQHENDENAALGIGKGMFDMAAGFAKGHVFGMQHSVQSGLSGQMGESPLGGKALDQFRPPSVDDEISSRSGQFGLPNPFTDPFKVSFNKRTLL